MGSTLAHSSVVIELQITRRCVERESFVLFLCNVSIVLVFLMMFQSSCALCIALMYPHESCDFCNEKRALRFLVGLSGTFI